MEVGKREGKEREKGKKEKRERKREEKESTQGNKGYRHGCADRYRVCLRYSVDARTNNRTDRGVLGKVASEYGRYM